MTAAVFFVLVAWLLLNAVATVAVLRKDELSARKRAAQIVLVWLVPCIGAVVCLAFVITDTLQKDLELDNTAFVDGAGASFPVERSPVGTTHTDFGNSGGDGE